MNKEQPKNPLHGIPLKVVVTQLVEHFGWEILAEKIEINCFKSNPSINSSLTSELAPIPNSESLNVWPETPSLISIPLIVESKVPEKIFTENSMG